MFIFLRKLYKWFYKVIKQNVFKRPYRLIKRHYKLILKIYLSGLLPASFAMTTLTTQLKPTNLTGIASSMLKHPINTATWGTVSPMLHGVESVVGSTFKQLGNTLHIESLAEKGNSLKSNAASWFKQGSDYTKNATAKITAKPIQATPVKPNNDSKKSDESKDVVDWTFASYPDYYRVISKSTAAQSEFPADGQIKYSYTDDLGRTQTVWASINFDLTQKGVNKSTGKKKRQSFSTAKKDEPSGWPSKYGLSNDKVSIDWLNGKTYNGYMYNRSHLVGDAIGGDAVQVNAITGTRPQNVGGVDSKGGMRYTEMQVEKYFKDSKNQDNKHVVYYKAQPLYHGKDLVPYTVIVDVHSNDGVINDRVQVFNTANGWTINYADGTYSKAK